MSKRVPPAKLNPVALLGMVWTWAVLGLWGLGIAMKPPLEGRWSLVFALVMTGIFLSGLGLAATLILQPWRSAGLRKKLGPIPRLSVLWDREIDG